MIRNRRVDLQLVVIPVFPAARTRSCAHESCNLSQCYEISNKGHSNFAKQGFNDGSSRDEYNLKLSNSFSKSCSIEDLPQPSQLIYSAAQPSASCRPMHQPASRLINGSQNSISDSREDVNLHQKLRRQLTLNPAGSDPRIFHMQQQAKLQLPKSENSELGHRLLEASLSGPRTHISKHWDLHQVRATKYSSLAVNVLTTNLLSAELDPNRIGAGLIAQLAGRNRPGRLDRSPHLAPNAPAAAAAHQQWRQFNANHKYSGQSSLHAISSL